MIKSEKLLDECKQILCQRGQQYGDAGPLYRRTALMWTAYLNTNITDHDVCTLMALMKIGRLGVGVDDTVALKDTYQDSINYLALAQGLDE